MAPRHSMKRLSIGAGGRKPSCKSNIDVSYIEPDIFNPKNEIEEKEQKRNNSFFALTDKRASNIEPYQYSTNARTSKIEIQTVKDKLESDIGGDILYKL